MSSIDLESKLNKEQAKKLLKQMMLSIESTNIILSGYFRKRLKERKMESVDAYNVLKHGRILVDPEWEQGEWRYRVETQNMLVVIAFTNPNTIRCITCWRLK